MKNVKRSRTKNSKVNIITGISMQILNIVLPFIVRTVILYVLGVQYQGLSSLFTSVLQVLNLADLGFSSAVIFALYKPIAQDDTTKINAIINFLRRVYFIVGIAILVVGLALTPAIPYIIADGYPADINIYLLYDIYVFNSSISYMFFAYKTSLFIAMQRKDVTNNISMIINTLVRVTQIVLLITTKNYYLFIICMPIGTIINNVLVQLFSRKYFPTIQPVGKVDPESKSILGKQIRAVCVDKICDVARNSFDNIVISALMGLTLVAIYSNYYYIFSAVYGLMIVINQAMQASVGNSIANETADKNYRDFKKLTFLVMWIVGFCTISMACLYQSFMIIWMRNDETMLLSIFNMLLFCLYFYLINMNNSRNLYLEGSGLFYRCKKWYIIEAASNLGLNFLLGYFWGITGILVATIITIFFFNFIARSFVLFKYYFENKGIKYFFLTHFLSFIVTGALGTGIYFLCSVVTIEGFVGFLIKAAICLVAINVGYLLIYIFSKDFKNSFRLVKNALFIRK